MIRTRDINVPVMAGMTSSCLFSEVKGVNYPFSDLDLRLIIKITCIIRECWHDDFIRCCLCFRKVFKTHTFHVCGLWLAVRQTVYFLLFMSFCLSCSKILIILFSAAFTCRFAASFLSFPTSSFRQPYLSKQLSFPLILDLPPFCHCEFCFGSITSLPLASLPSPLLSPASMSAC